MGGGGWRCQRHRLILSLHICAQVELRRTSGVKQFAKSFIEFPLLWRPLKKGATTGKTTYNFKVKACSPVALVLNLCKMKK